MATAASSLDALVDALRRLPGVGVFLTTTTSDVPPMMQHLVRLTGVLPTTAIILSVTTAEVPRVPSRERLQVESLSAGLWRVTARYGFMQTPNLPVAVRRFAGENLEQAIDPDAVEWRLYLKLFDEIDREFRAVPERPVAPFLSIVVESSGRSMILKADPAAEP